MIKENNDFNYTAYHELIIIYINFIRVPVVLIIKIEITILELFVSVCGTSRWYDSPFTVTLAL
jgi:hypothetical protein